MLFDGASESVRDYRYPSIPVRKNETVSILIGQRLFEKSDPKSSREKQHLWPYYKLGNIATFIGEVFPVNYRNTKNIFKLKPGSNLS